MSVNITTELVKELRDATGVSVMQCKKALEEAEGDMKKALAILKKTSGDIALKKKDRQALEGAVMVKRNGNKSAIVALHCETDFVSRNEDFVNLLSSITDKALEVGVEELASASKDMIDMVIQKTGENIQLGQVSIIEGEVVGSYVHNNKVAVVVSLSGGNEELAKDVAMHFAAMKPEYTSKEDIDEEAKKTIMEVFEKEIASIDKPEDIKKKMLEGKINTYFKEKTLLDQPFIKNPDLTVGQLIEKQGAKLKEVKYYSI